MWCHEEGDGVCWDLLFASPTISISTLLHLLRPVSRRLVWKESTMTPCPGEQRVSRERGWGACSPWLAPPLQVPDGPSCLLSLTLQCLSVPTLRSHP